jgi:antitoxin component of RelBE/YafQ-DinJ toxin-antitoxin module
LVKKAGPNLGISIDEDLKRRFDAACTLRGLTMTEVLKKDIERHLAQWEKAKEESK